MGGRYTVPIQRRAEPLLKSLIERHPVLSSIVLAYTISWTVWFAIPLFTTQWPLVKVLAGVGLGPGLAAVLLARVQGFASPMNARWWRCFSTVAIVVAALGLWNLLAPDARTASELTHTPAVGLTAVGITGSALLGIVCGFIFASAATSRSPALQSIWRWRVPVRWWLTALLLPLTLLALSAAAALAQGETITSAIPANLSRGSWAAYTIRSVLFTLLVVGIGEETGWRGYLLPALQKRFSPLNSSLILGVLWGFWHFPLFVIGAYPGGPESIVMYLFIGPILAILFTWLFNHSGQALLPAICLHTAINNSSRFVAETTLYPVLLIAIVITVVIFGRMWSRSEDQRAISNTWTRALPRSEM